MEYSSISKSSRMQVPDTHATSDQGNQFATGLLGPVLLFPDFHKVMVSRRGLSPFSPDDRIVHEMIVHPLPCH